LVILGLRYPGPEGAQVHMNGKLSGPLENTAEVICKLLLL
jgi:hypothetical protein